MRGSARAEDLLFETPAGLIPTPRNWAITINGAQQAWIQDAEFTCVGTPIHVVKPYTVVTLVNFTHHRPAYGSYPARTHVTEFAELYGERSAGFWSVTKATNRAKLEVLLAAQEVQRAQQLQAPIHEYIAHQKQRKVFALGDYGHEGMERLNAIKVSLERLQPVAKVVKV